MGPIWGRQDPGGPHVGPMNFVIWVGNQQVDKNYMYNNMHFHIMLQSHKKGLDTTIRIYCIGSWEKLRHVRYKGKIIFA